MASIKLGIMVPAIAGSVGGTIFQRGNASQFIRNKPVKRSFILNPQQAILTIGHRWQFASIARLWSSIGATDQAAWVTATALFPRLNKFGDTYTPSGYQLFCEFNMALLIYSYTVINTAPLVSTFPATPFTATYDADAGTVTIACTTPFPTTPYVTIISASNYVSNGRSFEKAKLKYILKYQFDTDATSLDITYEITQIFGDIVIGSQMWFSLKFLNTSTGELSSAIQLNVLYTPSG